MIKVFLVLLCYSVLVESGAVKKDCDQYNISKQKCSFGKGQRCVPRVTLYPINWDEVQPWSFVARWKPIRSAKCYYVEVLTDFTSIVMKTFSCHPRTEIKITGLRSWRSYGVQVSAVNHRCQRGRPSRQERVKTLWASTPVPTTTAPPTYSPRPGKCGKRRFTCLSNSKCISLKKYCDRAIHCNDGSDERSCPGNCREIDVDFKNGNYSCSRWGSPGSFCFFDCKFPYVRDGFAYTRCYKRKQWTNPVPTCRLPPTESMSLLVEETTATSVKVEWQSVTGAKSYLLQAAQDYANKRNKLGHTVTVFVNSTECCSATIEDLKPDLEVSIKLRALDEDGVEGMDSVPLIGRTEKSDGVVKLKSGSEKN